MRLLTKGHIIRKGGELAGHFFSADRDQSKADTGSSREGCGGMRTEKDWREKKGRDWEFVQLLGFYKITENVLIW